MTANARFYCILKYIRGSTKIVKMGRSCAILVLVAVAVVVRTDDNNNTSNVISNYTSTNATNITGNSNNTVSNPEQYFIDRIFAKYGDKGIITFEVSI